MQELINKVTEASAITEDQAKKAIEVVSGYLKEKLPESFHSQIDNLVNGGTLSEGIKNKFNYVTGDLRDKGEELIQEVRDKAEEVAAKLKDMFSDKK